MRSSLVRTALAVLAGVTISSCSDTPVALLKQTETPTPTVQRSVILPSVRISEIHYDNAGTDTGEQIEISGPAGTSLTGWSLVLYNGSGGASYNTVALTGSIPTTCGTRGVVVRSYPSNGIQNGAPDGVALVDASGAVVEFLSYEGTFTATNGPANGMLSVDIGVSEAGTESASPVTSLKRDAAGVWSGPSTHNFGSCNDNDAVDPEEVAYVTLAPATRTIVSGMTLKYTAQAFNALNGPIANVAFTWGSSAPAVASVSSSGAALGLLAGSATITVTSPNGKTAQAALQVEAASQVEISEIHYNNDGVDVNEAIEIEGPAGQSVNGWSIVLYNGSNGTAYNTASLSGVLPATCGDRGVLVVNYPSNGIQNGDPDAVALVNASGVVVDFISYGGTLTGVGGAGAQLVSSDIGIKEGSSAPADGSLQKGATQWYSDDNSFGACNPPVAPVRITISGRTSSDPALPVGFEDQIFVRLTQGGVPIPMSFTLTSETPGILSIDSDGVVQALAAGTGVIRATAQDGTTRTFSLATTVATASTTAQYGHNTEFGEPADDNASDDFIIRREQMTSSFNSSKGIPNWVAYNIDATHFGPQDRCDCFTFDPELVAAGFTRYTTADYTGAGAAAAYDIDRGHLARSFDRTAGSLDNARTFYFSNIIPQASDNNQGPWADFEIFLGDKARFENKEVFVIAGASGSKGTVKDEGLITIPEYTWKVAVLMSRDEGLGDVSSTDDVEIIAVIMPNGPGIRNVDWNTYRTSVDAVEALSGYDVLALLPDEVEAAVEGTIASIEAAIAQVAQLVADGVLDKQDAKWYTLKLELAIKELEKGNRIPAQNQLEEVARKLEGTGVTGLIEAIARIRAVL